MLQEKRYERLQIDQKWVKIMNNCTQKLQEKSNQEVY